MGKTVPVTRVTDFDFANKDICEDGSESSADCVLLEKQPHVTNSTVDRVNCSSGRFRFRFNETNVRSGSFPLKVSCEVKQKGTRNAHRWYFYVDKFGKRSSFAIQYAFLRYQLLFVVFV